MEMLTRYILEHTLSNDLIGARNGKFPLDDQLMSELGYQKDDIRGKEDRDGLSFFRSLPPCWRKKKKRKSVLGVHNFVVI